MGGGASRQNQLTEKTTQKLVLETGFAPSELEYLFRRYKTLCKRGENLCKADIIDNQNLSANPYVSRFFGVIPKNEFGEVTFEMFVKTAAIFRPGKDITAKLKYIFNLFDYNMDGTLDPSELKHMIQMIRPDIEESENEELVNATMADILAKGGDTHKDGRVHSASFVAYAKLLPGIDKLLTLNLAEDLALQP